MEEFRAFLEDAYGNRADGLLTALTAPPRQVSRRGFGSSPPSTDPWWFDCHSDLSEGYVLDPASVVVARALDVKEDDRVLDMCAAPGGKAMVLLDALGKNGHCTLNELSTPRRMKMKQILRQHLPEPIWEKIKLEGRDGLTWGVRRPESFDRVLLDAPCSGERHLLTKDRIGEWTPKRARNLARKQFGLLASAALTVKRGGTLIYSTCSLNPIENDGVVSRLLKRRPELSTAPPAVPLPADFESTDFGWIALPDRTGFGPMYFARLHRS